MSEPTSPKLSPSGDWPVTGSDGTQVHWPPIEFDGQADAPPGYEILEELGRGGMGVVFKARQTGLDRVVALKMILAGQYADGEERARFQAEAEVVARLRHPNIVGVHEVGQHAGRPFQTLEFLPGGPLSRRLAGRPLPAGDAARLAELLARAVQYAHQQGVVHRDLKPANILLEEGPDTPPGSWTPKVADFGLAKRLDDSSRTASGAVLGTPSYMSPEQAAGRVREVGPASDVYALGAILYELLTGRPPFLAASAMETMLEVMDSEPVGPRQLQPKVPVDLETICLKCLEKSPNRRYASAADLSGDLASFRVGEPIRARRVGPAERALKWARRRPAVAALLAAVVLLTAAGLGSFTWAYRRALDQRDRAVVAEGERQAELARALAGSARLAARRGDWEGALRDYQAALELGGEDEVGLRLGVLECRTALYQIPRFREELAELAGRDDVGQHAGAVRLMQAYEALGGSGDLEEARAAVRQALELELPPADRHYARALLAPTLAQATEHARAAVRDDPAHRRALELLAPLLFLQGRLRESRETVVQLQAAAPNSLSGLIPRAFLLAREGDLAGALQLCDALEPVYGKDGTDFYRDVTRLVADFTDENFLWGQHKAARTVALWGRCASVATRLGRMHEGTKGRHWAAWSDFVLMRLPCFQVLTAETDLRVLSDLRNLEAALKRPGGLPAALARLAAGWPDGYLHYLRAILLSEQDKDEEMERELLLALEKPSFMRVEGRARFELLRVRWRRAERLEGPARKRLHEQARGDLRRLLALGGEYPAWVNSWLWHIAHDLGDDATSLVAARSWAKQAPNDPLALNARFEAEWNLRAYAEATETMRSLRRLKPSDVVYANRLGLALFNGKLYRSALTEWLESLQIDPDNKTVRGNLTTLERRLHLEEVVWPFLQQKLRLTEPLVLARRGQHAEAVKQAAVLVPDSAGGDALFALACVQALASKAARGDAPLADQYARDSLASLKKARDGEYFKERLHVEMVGNEVDLAGLADRADFRQFLKELNQR